MGFKYLYSLSTQFLCPTCLLVQKKPIQKQQRSADLRICLHYGLRCFQYAVNKILVYARLQLQKKLLIFAFYLQLNIWRYGDFRDDDADEFGYRR